MQQRVFSAIPVGWHLCPVFCVIGFIGCVWPERVEYKVCLLVFKALHGMASNYLSELCRPNAEDTARSRLPSAARGDLQVPRSKTNFGSRAFAVAGPMFWNILPPEIRANDSLQSFKSQLKTYYF